MTSEPAARQGVAIRSLVLDDNEDFADNLGEILQREGSEVQLAHSIREARQRIRTFRPDVAFVDLRLPDGEGQSFIELLHERVPECLAIVLTGDASIQAAVSSVSAGAFGFVLKDIPIEGILAEFRRACERLALSRETHELQAKLRDQEHLALIGQMAATLAHEIRNPLTGISQALEVLLDAVGEPPSMTGLKESILDRFRSLNELVEELLQFSKPLAIKPVPTDVGALLRRSVDELRADGRLDGVEIAFDLEAPEWLLDETHGQSLVRNLLQNALQAVQEAGTDDRRIILRTRRLVDGRFSLEVEDTGAGVPDATRIFEPFFTTRTRGTGLGLALVRRIVDEHGGTIEVSNVPGARFTLAFPGEPTRKGAR